MINPTTYIHVHTCTYMYIHVHTYRHACMHCTSVFSELNTKGVERKITFQNILPWNLDLYKTNFVQFPYDINTVKILGKNHLLKLKLLFNHMWGKKKQNYFDFFDLFLFLKIVINLKFIPRIVVKMFQ